MARGEEDEFQQTTRRAPPRRRLPRAAVISTRSTLPDSLSYSPSERARAAVVQLCERALVDSEVLLGRGVEFLRLAELHGRLDAPCVRLFARSLTTGLLEHELPLDRYAASLGVVPRIVDNVCLLAAGKLHLVSDGERRTLCGRAVGGSGRTFMYRDMYQAWRNCVSESQMHCNQCSRAAARGGAIDWPDPALYATVEFTDAEREQIYSASDDRLITELLEAETKSDFDSVISGFAVRATYQAGIADWIEQRIEPELALARFKREAPSIWSEVLDKHWQRTPLPAPENFTVFLRCDSMTRQLRSHALGSLFVGVWRNAAVTLESAADKTFDSKIRTAACAYRRVRDSCESMKNTWNDREITLGLNVNGELFSESQREKVRERALRPREPIKGALPKR